jgi:hypothetical protein
LNLANEMSTFSLTIEEEMEPTFYTQLWKIQTYCMDPSLVASDFVAFENCCNQILKVFSQKDLNYRTNETFTETLIPSRAMLDIQLDDPNFKVSICLQILMLLQNFEVPIKSLEVKTDKISSLSSKIHAYMKSDYFSTLIQRGLVWDSWKKMNCIETFEKPPKVMEFMDPVVIPEDVMNEEKPSLYTVSTCNELLDKLRQQMDPEAAIEEEYSLNPNKIYGWKVLRSMALAKFQVLENANNKSTWGLIQQFDGKEEEDNKKRPRSDDEEEESSKKVKMDDAVDEIGGDVQEEGILDEQSQSVPENGSEDRGENVDSVEIID